MPYRTLQNEPGMMGAISHNLSTGQRCPACDALIQAEAVNITEGVAQCSACGQMFRLSEIRLKSQPVTEIFNTFPRGCSVEVDEGQIVVKASCRSWPLLFALCCMTLFWNGLLSVFVSQAIAGVYINFLGELPAWLPEAIASSPPPKDQTTFLCIFLIPFVLVGIMVLPLAVLSSLFGSVKVVIRRAGSYASSGVGPLRWWKRFNAQEVESVKMDSKRMGASDIDVVLLIDSTRKIRLGYGLSAQRLEWMYAALTTLLLSPQLAKARLKIRVPRWLLASSASRSKFGITDQVHQNS